MCVFEAESMVMIVLSCGFTLLVGLLVNLLPRWLHEYSALILYL